MPCPPDGYDVLKECVDPAGLARSLQQGFHTSGTGRRHRRQAREQRLYSYQLRWEAEKDNIPRRLRLNVVMELQLESHPGITEGIAPQKVLTATAGIGMFRRSTASPIRTGFYRKP